MAKMTPEERAYRQVFLLPARRWAADCTKAQIQARLEEARASVATAMQRGYSLTSVSITEGEKMVKALETVLQEAK